MDDVLDETPWPSKTLSSSMEDVRPPMTAPISHDGYLDEGDGS